MSENEADRIQPDVNVSTTTNQEPEVIENFLGGPINWEAMRYSQGDVTGTSGYGVVKGRPPDAREKFHGDDRLAKPL